MPSPRFLPAVTALSALVFLIPSCHQLADKQQLLTINQGLTRSLDFIQNNTNVEYASLQNRLSDPQTSNSARQWAGAILENKQRTDAILDYIDALAARYAGSESIPTETSKALFDTLIQFKYALIKAFPESLITENEYRKKDWDDYCRHFPLFAGLSDSLLGESSFKAWYDTTFGENSQMALLALNKLKIDIALSAKLVAHYCKWLTEPQSVPYTVFQPLVTLNVDVVKPGETIIVDAGIGTYSSKVSPKITIDGKLMPLMASAVAEYEFKAPRQPGKHTIPISMVYYKPDGSMSTVHKTVSYFVTQP